MSLKKTFSSDGKKCTVVFTVNPEAAAGATKVYLAGDFNSWDPTSIPMKKDPNGSFSVKKQLETNKEFQFRYCIDGNVWINDWKADKYVRSEFASDDNSVVDTTVPKAPKVSKKPTSKAVNKSADKKPAAKKPAAKKTTNSFQIGLYPIDKVSINLYINTHLFIPRLCNGSTSDSGSDCGGSNPPWGTQLNQR